jgi:hypothetical protein
VTPTIATLTGACVASAAIHAVLAPAHLVEGSPLGVAFVAAAAALAALASALVARVGGGLAVAAAVAVLATLVAGYGLEPILAGDGHRHEHDGRELGGLAAALKTLELVGIAAGLFALRARRALRPQPRVAVGGPERRP